MFRIDKKVVWFTCIVFLALFVLIAGLWFYKNNASSSSKPSVSFSFSPNWENQAQFAGFFVALEKDFYKKAGLDVSVNNFDDKKQAVEALESGDSDFALMDTMETLINYSKGKEIKAIAAFYQVSPMVIVSLKKSGIEHPEDLRGKSVGIKEDHGDKSHAEINIMLQTAGIKESELKFVDLASSSSEKEDLLNDRVDAVVISRTRLFQLDKEGLQYNVIYPEDYGASLYNDVLVADVDVLDRHPKEAKAFVRATIDGWEYAYDHPEEAIAMTLKYVKDEEYLDPDYERYILEQSKPLMTFESKHIGDMDLEKWKDFYGTFLENGSLSRSFNVDLSFTREFLPY